MAVFKNVYLDSFTRILVFVADSFFCRAGQREKPGKKVNFDDINYPLVFKFVKISLKYKLNYDLTFIRN